MRIQVGRLSKQEGIDSNHTYVWCTDLIPDSSCQYDTRIFILAPITYTKLFTTRSSDMYFSIC